MPPNWHRKTLLGSFTCDLHHLISEYIGSIHFRDHEQVMLPFWQLEFDLALVIRRGLRRRPDSLGALVAVFESLVGLNCKPRDRQAALRVSNLDQNCVCPP